MTTMRLLRRPLAVVFTLAAFITGGCGSILPDQATSYYLLQDLRADEPRQPASAKSSPDEQLTEAPAVAPIVQPAVKPAVKPVVKPAAKPAKRPVKGPAKRSPSTAAAKSRGRSQAATATPPPAPPPPAPMPPMLLISVNPASTLYESAGIVFSRGPAERAYYQLGSWSERPSRRLGLMIEQRLVKAVAAGLPLASVALDTSGVRGDWLLGVRLIELYHDTTTQPDRAVVTVEVELIDWDRRRMLDRAVFSTTAALHGEQIDGAVAALNEGLTQVLDQLEQWVETKARSLQSPP